MSEEEQQEILKNIKEMSLKQVNDFLELNGKDKLVSLEEMSILTDQEINENFTDQMKSMYSTYNRLKERKEEMYKKQLKEKEERIKEILDNLELVNEQPDYYTFMKEAGMVVKLTEEEIKEYEQNYENSDE